MAEKIVLCRRDDAPLGERPAYCGRPIEADKIGQTHLCRECRAKLPIWPVGV